MTKTNKSGLSPVAALCLRVVQGWLGVVRRGKGGELRSGVPYTRLKAIEVQQQLEAEQGVAVSSKTVQRALTQLVAKGHLSRRQLYKSNYNRTYWYSPGQLEQQLENHRPRSVQRRAEAGAKSVPTAETRCPSRRDRGVPSPLDAQITINSNQKAAESQAAQQAPTEEPETVVRAWRPKHQAPTVSPSQSGSGRWQQAQQRLNEVVQRATGFKGFGARQQGSSSRAVPPSAYQVESAQVAGFIQ